MPSQQSLQFLNRICLGNAFQHMVDISGRLLAIGLLAEVDGLSVQIDLRQIPEGRR